MGFRRLETLGDLAEAGFRLIVGPPALRPCPRASPSRALRRVTPMRAWPLLEFRRAGRDVMGGIDKDAP